MNIDINFVKENISTYRETNRNIERIIKSLVKECCSDLDDLIRKINMAVQDLDNPITDEELDYFILNLPICVYYAYEQQEFLGISEDLAKQEKSNIYNDTYTNSVGTIVDKKQLAESATKNQQLLISIYARASKQIRNKLDIATELLQSLKKVSTRRMNERNMEMSSINRVKGDY